MRPGQTATQGRLHAILRGLGLRRVDLAVAARCSDKTIARIDAGDVARLNLGTLCRVAVALGVRPSDLLPELHTRPRVPGLVQVVARQRAAEREAARKLGAHRRKWARDDLGPLHSTSPAR